ncbi:MAG: glycosyltransferase family 2 protein [Paludibacteraceae bacterium]|nr:glycosyltransferase family 2 protein [Paludibacteraceae bacterium]
MTEPLVSICCLCYNHEPYIRDCLDGFMMQKTNFAFEVLIHDDASTDKSADIIREYEAKYPGIIKPIYQTENQYSKGVGVSMTYQFPRAKGKYIAMCEGDDYWTDPYKLQKQVDFLEANEEYSICFHPVKVSKENEKELVDDFITREVPETTTILDLAEGNYMHTPSVVFRRNQEVFDDFLLMGSLPLGDYVLHMLNAKYGKIKKLPDIMGVYRVHIGGVWSEKSYEFRVRKTIETFEKVKKCFNSQVENLLQHKIESYYFDILKSNVTNKENLISCSVEFVNTCPDIILNLYNENCLLKEEFRKIKTIDYKFGTMLLTPFRKFKRLIKRNLKCFKL